MPEVLYTAIIATAKLGMRALGQPIDITGLEHLPRTGPALLAVNHVGYVDFIYGGVAPRADRTPGALHGQARAVRPQGQRSDHAGLPAHRRRPGGG